MTYCRCIKDEGARDIRTIATHSKVNPLSQSAVIIIQNRSRAKVSKHHDGSIEGNGKLVGPGRRVVGFSFSSVGIHGGGVGLEIIDDLQII